MTELLDPPNTYAVPLKTWNRWAVAARHIFNRVYDDVMCQGRVFYGPIGATAFNFEEHKVAAWNAAWTAASNVTKLAREY
jgi:hypothetical protein